MLISVLTTQCSLKGYEKILFSSSKNIYFDNLYSIKIYKYYYKASQLNHCLFVIVNYLVLQAFLKEL